MAVGAGGTRGTAPHFSKSQAMCPFPCILVALLEDSEDTQIASKICISSDFSGSKFQNFLGEHGPPSYFTYKDRPFFILQEFFYLSIKCYIPRQSA